MSYINLVRSLILSGAVPPLLHAPSYLTQGKVYVSFQWIVPKLIMCNEQKYRQENLEKSLEENHNTIACR
jgi:hypothetical protein